LSFSNGEASDGVRATVYYWYDTADRAKAMANYGSCNGSGGNDRLYGQAGNDYLQGGSGSDRLYGGAGDDFLYGSAGSDLLNGQAGDDGMFGGTGNDRYYVNSLGDTVTENAGEGSDTVYSSIVYTLGANLENLRLIGGGAIDGTGNELNNVLVGNAAANVLSGLAGSDSLNGGGGADTLIGGIGNDRYYVNEAGDTVVENPGEGNDRVYSQIDYTLPANVENLTLTGSAGINGTGNTLDNQITGNKAANVLSGLAGDDSLNGAAGADTLIGGDGNDYLNGGSGADAMIGGAGDDTYVVDTLSDLVTEDAAAGTDRILTRLSYVLGTNLENLTLTGRAEVDGTGNEMDNVLQGNTGANRLFGQAGDDVLTGSTGDDRLYGQVGDDRLYGQGGSDRLYGGSGDDYLNGGGGADRMIGGSGDDSYVVNSALDVVSEGVGGGFDAVLSSITYRLASNFENLTLIGSHSIDGTGTGAANVIVGNTAANQLNGRGGNDTIDGGAGNDVLYGAGGKDTLDGGDGNDMLYGLSAADTLTGGTGNDVFCFTSYTQSPAGDGNRDTVTDFENPGLAIGDLLDLSAMDADLTTTGNQAFDFVGMDVFSGTAGELRVMDDGAGGTLVQADLTGNALVDFELVLQGIDPNLLTQNDFVL